MDEAIAPKRRDARQMRSRIAMHRALFALLAEGPFDRITGAMVADRAGIGYSTFFRHYPDVRALLVDAVRALTDDFAQALLPALLRQDGPGAARSFIDAVDARRAQIGMLIGIGDVLRRELRRQIVDRFAALPDTGATWLPRRLAIRIAVASTVELLDWWLNEDPEHDAADIAELLSTAILHPLMTRP